VTNSSGACSTATPTASGPARRSVLSVGGLAACVWTTPKVGCCNSRARCDICWRNKPHARAGATSARFSCHTTAWPSRAPRRLAGAESGPGILQPQRPAPCTCAAGYSPLENAWLLQLLDIGDLLLERRQSRLREAVPVARGANQRAITPVQPERACRWCCSEQLQVVGPALSYPVHCPGVAR
jgi:hypothetical protein